MNWLVATSNGLASVRPSVPRLRKVHAWKTSSQSVACS